MLDVALTAMSTADVALDDVSTADIGAGGSTVVYDWGDRGLFANTGDAATFSTVGDAVGNRLVLGWPDRWIPVLAEELRYNGWRRVENLVTASEDLTDASWVNGDTETTAELNHTAELKYTFSDTYLSGTTFTFRAKISSSTPGADVRFRVENDSGVDSGSIFEVSSTPTVYSSTITLTDDATNKEFRIQNQSGETVTFTIEEIQVEDVTGQSDQNPAEYVSTGVATGDELILAQAAANWLPVGNNTVADDGSDGVLITYVDTGIGARLWFDDDEGVAAGNQVVGKTYVITGQAKVGSGDTVLMAVNGVTSPPTDTITSTSFVDFKFVVVCNNKNNFSVQAQGMGAGETINIRNVSLKVADHGWNVDGVKYFATEVGNTVSSNVVTEATGSAIAAATLKGYFAEGAATELGGYSADFTDASWAQNGTVSATQDAVGLSGASNEAFTLTDSDGATLGRFQETTTITSSSDTHFTVARVAYDASPSVYPAIEMEIRGGGTIITQAVVFDPSDGSYVEQATDGSVISVKRVGDFWYITQSATDDSSGNTQLRKKLYPAYNSDATVTGDATATGSTIFASLEHYKTNYSFSPILTTGGTTKSRLADTGVTLPFDWTEVDAAGSIEFEVTPYFVDAVGATSGLLSSGTTTARFLYFIDSIAKRINLYDGTNYDTPDNTAWSSVGETVTVKVRWGSSTSRNSVDGVADVSRTYDGSFDPSGLVTLFKSLTRGAAIKNLVVYNEDKGDAWLEE